jgi:hypothetical protein
MIDIKAIIEELDRQQWNAPGFVFRESLSTAYPTLREAALDSVRASGIIEGWICKYDAQALCIAKLETERDQLRAQVTELRAALEIYKWRPIEEIHEDMGPCVMMRLDDPGYLVVGSNLDEDFNEPGFTHFAQVPKLTIKEAEALAEKPDTKETERLISFREDLTRKVAIPTSVPTSEPTESR